MHSDMLRPKYLEIPKNVALELRKPIQGVMKWSHIRGKIELSMREMIPRFEIYN
jgi:hypothetical protein